MVSLPDPALSRAILIGAHSYRKLPDLPPVEQNLMGLRQALEHPSVWGLPTSHCTVVAQPEHAQTALDALHDQAPRATDTLVVYYAGHGLVDPYTDELYLALPSTEPGRPDTALRYEYVRRAVLDPAVTARRKVVVLDSCYSGRARIGEMGAGGHLTAQALIDGACLLMSTAGTRKSLFFPGERYTAFTGELIDTLVRGIADGPALLDMDTIYRHVHAQLSGKRRPLPEQRNRNAGGLIVLARNRAVLPGRADSALDALAPESVPLLGGVPRRTLLTAVAGGTVALGGAGLGVRRLLHGSDPAPRRDELGAGTGPAPGSGRPRTTSPSAPPSSSPPTAKPSSSPTRRRAKPGALLWQKPIPASEYPSDVILVDGVVCLSRDGTVLGFDAVTGERRWTVRFEAPLTPLVATAVTSGGVLCVCDLDGHLHAIRIRDGDKRWSYRMGGVDAPHAWCTVRGGVVYASQSGGGLHAVDAATGKRRWLYAPAEGIDSAPAANDTVVCVGATGETVNHLDAVNARTGKRKWRFEGHVTPYLTIDARQAYTVNYGTVSAVDLDTGERRWSESADPPANDGPDLGPPTLAGGTLYTTTLDGYLTARDPGSGSVRWRFPVEAGERIADWGNYSSGSGSSGAAIPTVSGATLYLGSLALPDDPDSRADRYRSARLVYAVDTVTGTERWHRTTEGCTGTVAADDTAAYFATSDDHLCAVGR
nr:PQQ-binding-like beta-propeller repeat protein [Streptomyces palmae]